MTLPPTCLPAEPTTAPSDLSDLLAVCGAPAQSPGAAPTDTPFASVLTQAVATPSPSISAVNNAMLYPGIYYAVQAGSQAVPAMVSGVAPEIVSEKPKTPAQPEDVSGDEPDQVSLELVYQFVAGQWMPPPVPPVPLQETTQALGDGSVQNNLPDNEQTGAVQSMPAPLVSQNCTDEAPAGNPTARANTNLSPAGVPLAPSASLTVRADQPASSTPPQPAKSDDAPPFALEKPGAEQATVLAVESAGVYAPNRRFTQGRPTPNQAPEKFAASNAPGRPEITAGVNPSTGTEEKKSLSVDRKLVTATPTLVGTSTANREIAMSYSAANKSPTVDFSTTLGDGLQPNSSTETKVATTFAAHAPRLVQEIRAIADRISVIDRNSVEVRFDFSDTDRLSVRVEYRDGTVHTTFKTDSSQLRDVVVHEWQSQNSSSEQRSYRMADPVFSQTAADRQNFSGANDGSGRQRTFEQQAQHGAPSFASSGRSAGSTTSIAAPAARSARPETSQHLHALA